MTEQWRTVTCHEGYEVSDHGRVRSISRTFYRSNGRLTTVTGRMLKQTPQKPYGHLYVTIYPRGAIGVHRLVLEAFLSPCPDGMEVCHLDGNSGKNHLSNLAYATHKENCSHRVIHGTDLRGEKNPSAKITSDDVVDIRWLRSFGVDTSTMSELFGVSARHIRRILAGIKWAHV